MPVSIADDGADYIVTIAYPSTLTVVPKRNMGIEQKQYADANYVAQDMGKKIEAVCGSLQSSLSSLFKLDTFMLGIKWKKVLTA